MDFDSKREANHILENVIQNSQPFWESSSHYMLHPGGNQLHQDEDIKPVLTPGEHYFHPPSASFYGDAHFSSVSMESREVNPPTTSKSPQSRTVNSEDQCAETKENFDPVKYTCGGCNKHFSLICQLHHHLLTHLESGTYIYNIDTKTAYPRYDSICRAVQTFDCKSDVLTDNYTRKQDENSENDMVEGIHEEQKEVDRNKEDQKVPGHRSKTFLKSKRKVKRLNDKRTGNALLSLIRSSNFERKLEENNKNRNTWKKFRPFKSDASQIKVDLDKNLSFFPSEKDVTSKSEQDEDHEKDQLNAGYCPDDDLVDKNQDRNDSDTDSYQSDLKFCNEDADKNAGGTKKKYKCEYCGIKFIYESKLDVHRFKKHSDIKKVLHECKWCNEVFMFKRDLLSHVTTCSRNEGLRCSICGEIFPRKADKMIHMASHQNEEDLTCKLCGKVTDKWQLMETHMKKRHWVRDIQCEKCGESFQFKYELQNHRGHCSGEEPISCPKCDMTFKTMRAWRNHYLVHTDDKPFVCHYCGYSGTYLGFLCDKLNSSTIQLLEQSVGLAADHF